MRPQQFPSTSTPNTMNTQDALHWIAEVFEEPAGRLNAGTAREAIAGWDSLGTLSLIAALDEKFDIHLDEKEIEAMAKVEDILAVLRRQGALAEA
jgi:acyl carrier protein